MIDPIVTPAILAGHCIAGLIGGPTGNAANHVLGNGARRLGKVLRQADRKQNHHLLRAAHTAYVEAMRDMAALCNGQASSAEERTAARALRRLVGEERFAGFRYDGEHFPMAEANAAIDRMFGAGIDVLDGGGTSEDRRAWSRTAVEDLNGWGICLTADQARLFEEGENAWAVRYRTQMGEALIADPAARTIFTAERLGELRTYGITLIDAVGRIERKLEEGFARSAQRDAQLLAILEELRSEKGQQIAAAQISETAILSIARKVVQHVVDPQQALAEIEAAVGELLALRAHVARDSNLDGLVEHALHNIDECARAGEFEAAATEAETAFREWEGREEERRERERRVGIRFAEENIRTNRLRRDPEAIARWTMRLLALSMGTVPVSYSSVSDELRRLVERGQQRGINLDLEVAAAIARLAAPDRPADEKAALNSILGIALTTLGERETDTLRLVAAVKAFGEASQIYARENRALNWAMTQSNLGAALQTLGEREPGRTSLDAAVAAFRAAAEMCTPDRLPVEWATIQDNLGNTLTTLGDREVGTDSLKGAVAAYRATLTVRSRDRSPSAWASTQNNLGVALKLLGMRARDAASLEEAVQACRNALEVRTRERLPLDWASTQTNLGNALQSLGELNRSTTVLKSAVEAHRRALDVQTRERLPLDWAKSQSNLGTSLVSLGGLERCRQSIAAGIEAYNAALEIFGGPNLESFGDRTRAVLARAEMLLYEVGR